MMSLSYSRADDELVASRKELAARPKADDGLHTESISVSVYHIVSSYFSRIRKLDAY